MGRVDLRSTGEGSWKWCKGVRSWASGVGRRATLAGVLRWTRRSLLQTKLDVRLSSCPLNASRGVPVFQQYYLFNFSLPDVLSLHALSTFPISSPLSLYLLPDQSTVVDSLQLTNYSQLSRCALTIAVLLDDSFIRATMDVLGLIFGMGEAQSMAHPPDHHHHCHHS